LNYLVNKPIVIGQITQWLLLLQEFNFKVIYKLGKVQFAPNQLSRVKNGLPIVGEEDQLHDVVIFLILTIDLYAPIKEYFFKGYFEDDVVQKERKCFTIKSKLTRSQAPL
jgi:hypothetical protein